MSHPSVYSVIALGNELPDEIRDVVQALKNINTYNPSLDVMVNGEKIEWKDARDAVKALLRDMYMKEVKDWMSTRKFCETCPRVVEDTETRCQKCINDEKWIQIHNQFP